MRVRTSEDRLNQDRAFVLDQMKAIFRTADVNARDLSAEEEREWSKLFYRFKSGGGPATTMDQKRAFIEKWDRFLSEIPGETTMPRFATREREQAEGRRISADRYTDPDAETVWIDRKTNQRILCLAPQDTLVAAGYGRSVGYTFGDLVRGLLLGKTNQAEAAALEEAAVSTGGAIVPSPLSASLIDAMRAQSVCIALGARTVPMDSKTLDIARVTKAPVPAWRDESGDVSETDVTFDRLQFVARSCSFIVRASRELIEDSSPNLDQVLRGLFARVGALEIDRACLAGNGGGSPDSKEPQGLLSIDGINEVSGGSLSSYDKFLDSFEEIIRANAPEPTGYAIDPHTFITLQKLKEGTTNAPLEPPEAIAGLQRRVTSTLLTQNSPESGNAIFGGWNELMIGMRTQLDIRLLTELYAAKGQVGFWCWLRMDVQVAHPKAFARLVSIT